MFYIYFLLDTRTDPYTKGNYALPHEPIYVGKGKGKRYLSKKDRNNLLSNKIKKIEKSGYKLKYIKIGDYSEDEAFVAEEGFINLFGRKVLNEGPLLNIQPGGYGGFSHINDNPNNVVWNKGLTKETDIRLKKIGEKISKSMVRKLAGDKNPSKRPDVRKKISERLKGHEVSQETRDKIRQTLINKEKNKQCV